MTAPVLYHIQVSHYSEKARWALDHKGVAHVRRAPLPMLHMAWAYALTRSPTFPVLKLDGRAIGDSTQIIAALERSHPDPPLYPADAAERARALALEEFFDEELGPHLRRAVFAEVTRDPETLAWVAGPNAGGAVHAGFKAVAGLVGPLVRLRYGAGHEGALDGWTKTYAAMDRLEAELGEGEYLVGDRFTVADLTAASLFFPFVRPAEAEYLVPAPLPAGIERRRVELAPRRGYRWVQEMYRRHRGVSAAVA